MADKEEESTNSGSDGSNDKTPVSTPTETVPSPKDQVPAQNPESTAETPEANAPTSNEEDSKPPTTPTVKEKKVEVLLKATGDAPIMAKKKWVVGPEQTIGWISEFIKKVLKLGAEERLFLYINQTFAPAPDQTVRNLYECYGTDGKLIIHYCRSQAWG